MSAATASPLCKVTSFDAIDVACIRNAVRIGKNSVCCLGASTDSSIAGFKALTKPVFDNFMVQRQLENNGGVRYSCLIAAAKAPAVFERLPTSEENESEDQVDLYKVLFTTPMEKKKKYEETICLLKREELDTVMRDFVLATSSPTSPEDGTAGSGSKRPSASTPVVPALSSLAEKAPSLFWSLYHHATTTLPSSPSDKPVEEKMDQLVHTILGVEYQGNRAKRRR